MAIRLIDSAESLEAFRQEYHGGAMIDLVRRFHKVLVGWAVGVGKSTSIDAVTEAAIRSGQYDLVMVFAPTRAVLEERPWLRAPPPGIKVVNLRPRPEQLCGKALDAQWKVYEKQGLGLLGRTRLCSSCPNMKTCFWPRQYSGKTLEGARVIYGTQAHLERDPEFLVRLKTWTGAEKTLLLLDEGNFIAKSRRCHISREQIEMYRDVLDKIDD